MQPYRYPHIVPHAYSHTTSHAYPPHTADPTSKPDPTETPVPTTTPGTAEPPDPPPLLQLPDVTSVVERVGPSVVSVLSQLGSNRFSSGSGVIFDD